MAYLFKRRFDKKKDNRMSNPATIIKGNPEAQKKWKQRFADQNIPINSNTNKKQIIFCEDPDLSWKEIIKEISGCPNGADYLFHGSGTHAAVASNSSRLQGEVIEI
jgi:hypothetical protein